MVANDLDGDGDLDLLASSVGNGVITWFENTDGQGTFSDANLVAIDRGVTEVSVAPNRWKPTGG